MSEVKRFEMEKEYSLDINIIPTEYPDGSFVHYEDYAALEKKIAALTAENLALKESVDHAAGCIHAAEAEGLVDALSSTTDLRLADLVHRRLCHAYLAVKTPATDAAANALRAEGVRQMKEHFLQQLTMADLADDEWVTVFECKQAIEHSAQQLREGKA